MNGDRQLWDAYRQARTETDRRVAAAEIVTHWDGWIRWYARKHAFPFWTEEVVDEYVHELVLVALTKIPAYDPDHKAGANFGTFLRPYLQGVRWTVAGSHSDIPVGRETRRMRADAHQIQNDFEAAGLEPPSLEQIAAFVSRKHGKKVTPARIARILDMPAVVRGDAPAGEDLTVWQTIPDTAVDVADEMVAVEERQEAIVAVRKALKRVCSSDLDWVLAERLMAPAKRQVGGETVDTGPASYYAIGRRFGLTVDQVVAAEDALKGRLREVIGEAA